MNLVGQKKHKLSPLGLIISLSKNVIPYKVKTTSPIPKHWQDQANDIVDELTEKSILAHVDEPTPWISLAFFVQKSNYNTSKPSHKNEQLDNQSKVFAKLDAVQGYHQVALDEPSSFLTTFLLPCGRFRYLCAPMGLCSSLDDWFRCSDLTIENIQGVCKLVDDYLISGKTTDELIQRLKEVLNKCHQQGITISKRKFKVNLTLPFTGFIIHL